MLFKLLAAALATLLITVVLIGATVADKLFPGEDPIGKVIRINKVPVQIVGVLAAKGQTPDGSDQDDVVLVPYTTARSRLSGWNFVGQILASTYSADDIPGAKEEMRGILREAHKLGEADFDDFTIRTQDQITEAAQGTTKVMSMLLAAIASISLLVGGIGIMNIMLVSVTERTREIGIRKAVGAQQGDILRQFLIEAMLISVSGGAIGIVLGVGLASLVGLTGTITPAITPGAALLATGFSLAVGLFFGIYPARRAARLDPIDALRYE